MSSRAAPLLVPPPFPQGGVLAPPPSPQGGSPGLRAEGLRPCACGFSFIEVMIALSMLLVGCLAILPLFALGVQNLAERRLADDLRRVRPEVLVIAQEEVDRSGGAPKGLDAGHSRVYDLSVKDYDVRIEWIPSPFHGPNMPFVTALAAVRRRGVVVYPLPPIALTRSTLDPAALAPQTPPTSPRR